MATTSAAAEMMANLPPTYVADLLAAMEECARYDPPNLAVARDCADLSIGGAGSRGLNELFTTYGFQRASHQHVETIRSAFDEHSQAGKSYYGGPTCFLVSLREPAGRLESSFHSRVGSPERLLDHPVLLNMSITPSIDSVTRIALNPQHPAHALQRSMAAAGREVGFDLRVQFAARARPVVNYLLMDKRDSSSIVNCSKERITVRFLCMSTMRAQFAAFAAEHNVTATTEVTSDDAYAARHGHSDLPSFMRYGAAMRRHINEQLYAPDWALVEHFCGRASPPAPPAPPPPCWLPQSPGA